MMEQAIARATPRVDWVDYAKGVCILLVVMMHSTLGIGEAMGGEGFLHDLVAFAQPFRMPAFFLIAGLFLSRSIDAEWGDFIDRKVVHFFYFYLLWAAIQLVLKQAGLLFADPAAFAAAYLLVLIEPFGTLWFIYMLPVFFIVTKLLRCAPLLAVFAAAVVLQMAGCRTGWLVVDEFAARYVYFFAGFAAAPLWFALADSARRNGSAALGMIGAFALLNGALLAFDSAALPVLSLCIAFLGAGAVIATAALLAEAGRLTVLRLLGAHSLTIYLAFFLPMAATRMALVRFDLVSDVGLASAIVTFVALVGPLLLWLLVCRTPARFLFERPKALRLTRGRRPADGEVWGPVCPLPRA